MVLNEKQKKLIEETLAAERTFILKSAKLHENIFAEYSFTDTDTGENIVQADFHRQIQHLWDKYDYTVVAVPKGHGKCLSLDSEIKLYKNGTKKISEIKKGDLLLGFSESLTPIPSRVINISDNGIQDIFELILKNGLKLKCTSNHPIFSSYGFKNLEDLRVGNVVIAFASELMTWLNWVAIKKIEKLEPEKTLNLTTESGNFIANGILVHNTENSIMRIIYELGVDPTQIIKIVCASEDLAMKRVWAIREHLSNNPKVREVFPHLKEDPSTKDWTKSSLTVTRKIISKEPSIEGVGILCVEENEEVLIRGKGSTPIKEVKEGDEVLSFDFPETKFSKVEKKFGPKILPLYKVSTRTHKTIKVSEEHRFLTPLGWKKTKELTKGDFVASLRNISEKNKKLLERVLSSDVFWEKIESIESCGEHVTYDIQVATSNYFCNGILTHNSTGVGGRATQIFFDDPVSFRNAIAVPKLKPQVKSAFWQVFMPMLSASRGKARVIATPYSKDDLIMDLLVHPQFKPYYRSIDDDFTPLWPEKFTHDKLIELYKLNPRAFDANFRLKLISDEDKLVSFEILEAMKNNNLSVNDVMLREFPKYVGVDLARSLQPGSSYTCIFEIAIDPNTLKRYPYKIIRGKFSSPDTVRLLTELYDEDHPMLVMVECNAYQGALIQWMEAVGRKDVPVVPFSTGANKKNLDIGLPSMANEFAAGLWEIPMGHEHPVDCKCSFCVWLKEIEEYPVGTYDTLMASWLAREAARKGGLLKVSKGQVFVW